MLSRERSMSLPMPLAKKSDVKKIRTTPRTKELCSRIEQLNQNVVIYFEVGGRIYFGLRE